MTKIQDTDLAGIATDAVYPVGPSLLNNSDSHEEPLSSSGICVSRYKPGDINIDFG